MPQVVQDKPKDHFLNDWGKLPSNGFPAWVKDLREQGAEQFKQLPYPHGKMEEWRQTNIASVVNTPYRSLVEPTEHGLQASDVKPQLYSDGQWTELVFVDGFFASELSTQPGLPEGVYAGSLKAALESDWAEIVHKHLGQCLKEDRSTYTALNLAFLQDGAFVYVPRNVQLDAPIHFVFLTSDRDNETASYLRNLMVLEESAEAQVIESFVSLASDEKNYLNDVAQEVILGANAGLKLYKVVNDSAAGNHLDTLESTHARDSRLTTYTFGLEGAVVRNQLCPHLIEEGSDASLHGLYLNDGDRLLDNMIEITHTAPHCTSRINYKGILDNKSKTVFLGKVHVHPEAQGTDSDQLSNNMLLSDTAQIMTKPQLEIYADDVKCTHGTTVGAPPEEVIFYFRSRGIDPLTANGMLTYGFADEVVAELDIEPLRDRLDRYVYDKYSPKDIGG